MISGVVYSEYTPYCSKWGWCVWTSLYGDQGENHRVGILWCCYLTVLPAMPASQNGALR